MLMGAVLVAALAIPAGSVETSLSQAKKAYREKRFDDAVESIDQARALILDARAAHLSKTEPVPALIPLAKLAAITQSLQWQTFLAKDNARKTAAVADDVEELISSADPHTQAMLLKHGGAVRKMVEAIGRLGGVRTVFLGDSLPMRVLQDDRRTVVTVWEIGLDSIVNTIQYKTPEERVRFISDKWLLPKMFDVAQFGEELGVSHVALGFTYGAKNLVTYTDGTKPEFALVVVPVKTARAYADAKITKEVVFESSSIYVKTMDSMDLSKVEL